MENNYRQGSIQHNFISFSGVVSETTPAIFYFLCPDFLKNQKCKINISLNPAIYFSKIASQNITKTLNILSDSPESNSNQNDIYVSENYYPPQATSGQWQGEGFSNIPEPQRENTLPSTIYYYENEEEEDKGYLRHFHQYKIIGEPSSNIFSSNVYHSHYFKMKKHSHKISFFDHRHKFSPHKHKFSSYSHNHNINLNHLSYITNLLVEKGLEHEDLTLPGPDLPIQAGWIWNCYSEKQVIKRIEYFFKFIIFLLLKL